MLSHLAVARPELQRRVVRTLSASQMLGGIGMATGLTVTALIAASISGSDSVGGLAVTAVVVGAALLALPVARLAALRGRRPALVTAYGIATAGAVGGAVGAAVNHVVVLMVALVAFGGGTTAGLAARYAATDLASPARRARDLSMVVWATTVGAVAGPNLAGPAQDAAAGLGVPWVVGPFLLSGAAFGLAAVTVSVGLRPDPLAVVWERAAVLPGSPDAGSPDAGAPGGASRGRSDRSAAWRALWSAPSAVLGLTGIMICHTVMVGLMSMTPVHMDHGGATLRVVGVVISLHIVGMYALSPLIGSLADSLGRVPVLILGALLLILAAGVAAGVSSANAVGLSVSLFLLGLGWSCGLVAGSALLTESVPTSVRPEAQGIGDLMMNLGGAVGGVSAGVAVAIASYHTLALAGGLLALPFLVVSVGYWLRRVRAGVTGSAAATTSGSAPSVPRGGRGG